MKKTLSEIETELRTKIKEAQSKGMTLTAGMSSVIDGNCFCAVGVALIGISDYGMIDDAAEVLGIDEEVVANISAGFEGWRNLYDTESEAYAIGQRIRRDLHKGQVR